MHSKRLKVLVVLGLSVAVGGCELIVEFDRTKIDGGGGGDSSTDMTVQDQTNDIVVMDVVNKDTGADTGTDTGADTGADTGIDSGSDASDGSVADAPVDSPADVTDE